MRGTIPACPFYEEATAIDARRRRLHPRVSTVAASTRCCPACCVAHQPVHHFKVKINLVNGDAQLASIILLGTC